jgi:hypothetical protein
MMLWVLYVSQRKPRLTAGDCKDDVVLVPAVASPIIRALHPIVSLFPTLELNQGFMALGRIEGSSFTHPGRGNPEVDWFREL